MALRNVRRAATGFSIPLLLGLFLLSVPALDVPGFHVVQTSGGGGFTCAITNDHKAWCWGDNRYGQLGQGYIDPSAATVSHFAPLEVPVLEAVEIRAGLTGAVCARTGAGAVYCWGNLYGGVKASPTLVGGLGSVAALAVGSAHVCAARTDGTVWCWGNNEYGQLGTGTLQYSATPLRSSISSVVSITAGYWHTCAAKADQSLLCWGRNLDGQIGTSSFSWREISPTPVGALPRAAAVAAGGWHTCARNADDDTVWCWGGNWWGQAGDGTRTDRAVPQQVSQILPGLGPDGEGSWLALGWMHSCAGRADGSSWCWGNADYGQLGSGEWGVVRGLSHTQPVRVAVDGFTDAAAGSFHTCASQSDGRLFCWGDNHSGQSGYPNPQQPVLGNLCFNYPSCTWSVPLPVVSRLN